MEHFLLNLHYFEITHEYRQHNYPSNYIFCVAVSPELTTVCTTETSAEITHIARETVPYAFSRTISDVLCTFKRFHNFIFHRNARWAYLGPGVKVGEFVLECENISSHIITDRSVQIYMIFF